MYAVLTQSADIALTPTPPLNACTHSLASERFHSSVQPEFIAYVDCLALHKFAFPALTLTMHSLY